MNHWLILAIGLGAVWCLEFLLFVAVCVASSVSDWRARKLIAQQERETMRLFQANPDFLK